MLQPEIKLAALSWQDLICRLDGVHAAKVVLSEDGDPEEIHILASTSKSPKTLTRDVQSALMAAFGVEVDYRIVSIAQVQYDLTEPESDDRLCYSGIDSKFIDGQGEITVFLTHGDSRIEGQAAYKSRNRTSYLRGVALATLNAISKCLSPRNCGHFELVATEAVEIGGASAILVTLCNETGQQFIGSSLVQDSNDDAVVRAVLDALNRRISRFITA